MKTTLEMPGKTTSAIEVTHIDSHGFWLFVQGKEYFLSGQGIKLDDAKSHAEKALVQDPENGHILDTLGKSSIYSKTMLSSQTIQPKPI
ncbi:MAG TPA: hypothetical protein DET40_09435 [Lentisphaeria bacterium]|nr:MAG: hypothetical protein A2X45_08225 [Lentisphaerae bacterium GWF2_50_93]HCE43758.1 hypothetical protein [Lentisphaeria bacterium]